MNDPRPRFGYCDDLDLDPQHITEKRKSKKDLYVVVIPLPFKSPKLRRYIREFVSKYLPVTR